MKFVIKLTYNSFQCETVLEIDPNNVKAYFRRGTAVFETGDPANALEDFLKVQTMKTQFLLLFSLCSAIVVSYFAHNII